MAASWSVLCILAVLYHRDAAADLPKHLSLLPHLNINLGRDRSPQGGDSADSTKVNPIIKTPLISLSVITNQRGVTNSNRCNTNKENQSNPGRRKIIGINLHLGLGTHAPPRQSPASPADEDCIPSEESSSSNGNPVLPLSTVTRAPSTSTFRPEVTSRGTTHSLTTTEDVDKLIQQIFGNSTDTNSDTRQTGEGLIDIRFAGNSKKNKT